MDSLFILIFLIAFTVGAVLGLLFSYKKHGEPFILNEINYLTLALAIIAWIFIFNYSLFSFIPKVILVSIGLLFAGFAIGSRPGYGRKETVIGIAIGLIVWFFSQCVLNIL